MGEAWFRATLPPALDEVLDLSFVDPTNADTIDGVIAEVHAAGLEHDRTYVFGHSAQGLLAMAYAAAHPQRTTGAIVVGTPPRMPLPTDVLRANWDQHAEPARRARADADPTRLDGLARWYDIDFDPSDVDALANDIGAWVLKVNVQASAAHDWDATRRRITCPVLRIMGGSDYLVPPLLWDGDTSLDHTVCTTVVLPKSGHQPFHDEPDAFVAAVRAFVETAAR